MHSSPPPSGLTGDDVFAGGRFPPPSPWPRWIATGAAVAAAAWVFWLHGAVLMPFVLATALAYVLQPLVERLHHWGVPRSLGVSLTVLATVCLGVLLFLLLVPIVADLAPMLKVQLPELVGRMWHFARPRLIEMGVRVPEELTDLRPVISRLINSYGERWALTALNSVRIGGSLLVSVASLAFLVPIIAFYLLLDWKSLWTGALKLIPLRWHASVLEVTRESDLMLGQYLRGQLLLMLTLAVYYSVAMSLFGIKLALPLGVFSGLVSCIPYLGYGLSLMLALLTAVLQFMPEPDGMGWALLSVGVVYGIGQVLETMILTPRMVGGRIGLHPVGVLLALVLFGRWMGFVGMLAALPLSALCVVILRRCVTAYQGSRYYRAPAEGAAGPVLAQPADV